MIAARGVVHTITLKVNRLAGTIDVERTTNEVRTSGTAVTLLWPVPIEVAEVLALLQEHAALNPHAHLRLIAGDQLEWCSPGPPAVITKWTPGKPTPIHWYSLERFEHRVLLELRHDPSITVAQFVGQFAGLADRSKRPRVAEAAGLQYKRLDAVLDPTGTALDAAPTQMLLEAMRAETRAPKPAVLGAVGKECAPALAGRGRS